jgi:hypothetical protein
VTNEDGSRTWLEVDTDASGFNDAVYITTLLQCLQLAPNESPFFSQYGIPAQPALVQQFFPDYYVAQTQSQFASYFTSLIVTKIQTPAPEYDISIVTQQGAKVAMRIPQ